MRHDIRLLYLCSDTRCPYSVSVRLPSGSCRRGCFFCCASFYYGTTRYSLKHILTSKDFLRLWEQIIFRNDFRFVWPQKKILNALKKKKVLRFVREDLFEPSCFEITERVLRGLFLGGYGLLVKTSSANVVKYISGLKKIKHCIVFSVTDLLSDFPAKIEAINTCVREGLNVTLSLSPIFEFNEKTKYILSFVERKILGVEVGWLHGLPSWIPSGFLMRSNYKYVRWERQYKKKHLDVTVKEIKSIVEKRKIPLRFYFSSKFYEGGACCFADKIF